MVGRRAAVAAIVIALVVALLNWPAITAWTTAPSEAASTPTATGLAPARLDVSPHDIAAARSELSSLRVIARPGVPTDYRRAAFGDAWSDTDDNGCNQRDDVLLRDVSNADRFTTGVQGYCDHDMLSGTWLDSYSGARITLLNAKAQEQAQRVQIDHIVALFTAWRYGADAWTDAKRLEFANDLRNLVAVGGAANQSKGGSDAAAWRPRKQAQCGYAVHYVTVKDAYGLPTDSSEKGALEEMLQTCP